MTKESDSPKDQSRANSLRRNLHKLKLELSNIDQGIQSYLLQQRMNANWGASRYGIGNEADEKTEDAYGPYSDGENYSVFNYTDEDEDGQSLLRCPSCDFGIEFSAVRRLQEVYPYDPKNMICPVCDEKLGEDAIKIEQHSSSQKRDWKSEESSVSSDNSLVLDKKLPTRASRHETMPDPLLSKFVCNVSASSSSSIHPGGDSSNNASDISSAKSTGTDTALDTVGDEEDNEERRLRASFVQELLLSTLF